MNKSKNINLLVIGHDSELGSFIKDRFQKHLYEVFQLESYSQMLLGFFHDVCVRQHDDSELLGDSEFAVYVQQMARRGSHYNNLPELRNEFYLSQVFCRGYIVRNKIDVIYFANIPHEGFDYVLHQVAVSLGIRVVVTHQSIFRGRFFLLDAVENLGKAKISEDYPVLSIESYAAQGLTYMKGVSGFSSPLVVYSSKIKSWVQRLVGGIKRLGFSWSGHRALKLLDWIEDLAYRNRLRCIFTKKLESLSTEYRYIYFPLHLQPELTTSAMGGRYDDQLLALQHLVKILPNNYRVLVKENPKQGSRYRGRNWFSRLRTIPKVFCLDNSVLSKDAIDASFAVASINGTAGWEALLKCKPVIYFGTAWYSSFPSVHKFSKDLNFNELEKVPAISLEDVEFELARMSKSMPEGIVDPYYMGFESDFSMEKNAENVVGAIVKYLNLGKQL